jgi:hypothetical protein
MNYFVLAGLVASICLNLFFAFKFHRKEHILTKDANALLHHLTKGKAILEVTVRDPAGLFYRSPRG